MNEVIFMTYIMVIYVILVIDYQTEIKQPTYM